MSGFSILLWGQQGSSFSGLDTGRLYPTSPPCLRRSTFDYIVNLEVKVVGVVQLTPNSH